MTEVLKKLSIRSFSGRRFIAGEALALLSVAVCGLTGSWMAGVCCGAAFLAAGALRLRLERPLAGFALNALWGLVCVFLSAMLPTVMVSDASFLAIGHFRLVMNYLCAAVVYGLCLALTGRVRRAVGLASGLLMLLATANALLFQFRGNELKALDFLSLGTAWNVAGQYSLTLQPRVVAGWLLWLWMVFVLGGLPAERYTRLWGALLRLGAGAAAVACAGLVWYGAVDVHTNTWSNEGTTRNGYLLNFYAGLRDSFVSAPEGYSAREVEGLAGAYPAAQAGEDLPNILVIMNESFVDLSVLGEVRTNEPVTPFLDSLRDDVIRGHALVSVYGGGTANSEYELLTGGSMANLPESSIAYQQYIHGTTYSLAWLLSSLGYDTMVTHPFTSTGWNRPVVYPSFGFEKSTFSDAYPWKDLLREFVSDREMYGYVLEQLENAREPLFLFGITMQNHGDYIYTGDHYTQTIFLEDYEGDYPMAEQYLTLLHESDSALEYLLTELEGARRDTIVLFFGDHFPQVESDFYQAVYGGELETLEERLKLYQVPFVIWANFPIEEQTVARTSLNYLSRYLLEAAGLDLPPYYQFLKELEQAIPAVSALGYWSESSQTYLPLEDAEGEEAAWLERYAMVQYNSLFDQDNLNETFFGQYLP